MMVLEEIFESGLSMTKTVWRKRGDKITRQEIKRMVATDVQPRSYITIKDAPNEG
jgi:hypothetical protein